MCCLDSPNYDPTAFTRECDHKSGCIYMGNLSAMYTPTNVRDHAEIEFLQTHNNITNPMERTGDQCTPVT